MFTNTKNNSQLNTKQLSTKYRIINKLINYRFDSNIY